MSEQIANSKAITLKDYEVRLLKVLAFIEANLGTSLSLDQLANVAHFSPYHFHRIFKGMTGETLGGFIRRSRLEKAAQNLLDGKRAITDIALDVGFENSESLSRAFKQHFGVPPSQFRRSRSHLLTKQSLDVALLSQFRQQARHFSQLMEKEGSKSMFDVQIKTYDPIRMAYLSHKGPYNQIGPVFEKAMTAVGEQKLFGPCTQVIALYHDDPHMVDPAELRSAAGISIGKDEALSAPLQEQIIDGGDYGVAIYKGPYDGLQAAYDWLYGHWLPQSGREVKGNPCLEMYLTDPCQTKPEDYLTEIRIPLV